MTRVHFQQDVPDYTGDGNFEPIVCGREEVDRLTHWWGDVTCKRCLARRPAPKAQATGETK